MRRSQIYILIFLIFAIISSLAYQYVFKIYEVTYSVYPTSLFADNQSIVTISTIPLNSFGWRAPLRNSYTNFNIKEGRDLIDIIKEDKNKGALILKAKNETGLVSILVKSEHSLLPTLIEIRIHTNITQK